MDRTKTKQTKVSVFFLTAKKKATLADSVLQYIAEKSFHAKMQKVFFATMNYISAITIFI